MELVNINKIQSIYKKTRRLSRSPTSRKIATTLRETCHKASKPICKYARKFANVINSYRAGIATIHSAQQPVTQSM